MIGCYNTSGSKNTSDGQIIMHDGQFTQPNRPMINTPPKKQGLPNWAIITISVAGTLLGSCILLTVFAFSPLGQQLAAQANATATADAINQSHVQATKTAYAFAHPSPTATYTSLPIAHTCNLSNHHDRPNRCYTPNIYSIAVTDSLYNCS